MKTEYKYKNDNSIMYPSEEQISREIEQILDRSRIQKSNLMEIVKAMFIGPGLSVIFYRFKLILLGSFLIYLFFGLLCQQFVSWVKVENSEYMTMLLFPMLHLVFQSLSLWSEEQEEMIELKKTLHYSFSYLVGLRMFYISILSALLNLLAMSQLTSYGYMGKLCAIGFSSMFLFTVIALVLSEYTYGYFSVFTLAVLWAVLCVLLAVYGSGISYVLFELLPVTVHIVMVIASFGLFIYYMGKVGRKYAYAY